MNIKKITLSMVGLLAAAAFAPEASAIPAFARQVGMACSACHYQHFPVLNAFGRAFKEGGYTLVGAQEKIEGDGISLPGTLNAALVGYMSYGKTNGPTTGTPTGKSSNDGQIQIPQQVSLFLGGRAGEHIGFEAEINMANAGTGTGQAGMIRFKVPFVFDVGPVKAGIVPFSTSNGVADSFEVLNTGAVNVHAFNQVSMPTVSAQQYIGTGTPANGVALIASNDDFFANIAKWGANNGDGTSGADSSTYVRAAWTTDKIPGFDSAIGFQSWSGTSANSAAATAAVAASSSTTLFSTATVAANCAGANQTIDTNGSPAGYSNCTTTTAAVAGNNGVTDTKAWAIDGQMMGDVHGMPLLVVASYAKAAAPSGANPNLFNAGTMDRSSLNIGAELGVLPNTTVQLAFRRAKSGIDAGTVGGTAGSNATDNAFLLGATYSIALNVRAELTYVKASGDLYTAAAANPTGDSLTYLDLAFGF